ncbi:Hypothetical protein A7982_01302 [Minicystis rosea]|nr:Hypothetical protein A7982_01302 [Minicystis rosea]
MDPFGVWGMFAFWFGRSTVGWPFQLASTVFWSMIRNA